MTTHGAKGAVIEAAGSGTRSRCRWCRRDRHARPDRRRRRLPVRLLRRAVVGPVPRAVRPGREPARDAGAGDRRHPGVRVDRPTALARLDRRLRRRGRGRDRCPPAGSLTTGGGGRFRDVEHGPVRRRRGVSQGLAGKDESCPQDGAVRPVGVVAVSNWVRSLRSGRGVSGRRPPGCRCRGRPPPGAPELSGQASRTDSAWPDSSGAAPPARPLGPTARARRRPDPRRPVGTPRLSGQA